MNVTVLDPVLCQVRGKEDALILSSFLRYKAETWKDGPFHKNTDRHERILVYKGKFLTGFLPRIEEYCTRNSIPLSIDGSISRVTIPRPDLSHSFPGNFRLDEHQRSAIRAAVQYQRGVIHHPTGSGKTEIFLYFINLFPNANSLIIVNTQDLLIQTQMRAERLFPGKVGIIGQGNNRPK